MLLPNLPRMLVAVPLRDRLETFRRDVRTVANDLLGERTPPFERRVPLGRHHHVIPRAAELLAPRTVRIARVVRETNDAVTLHLEDASGARIAFTPGEFLTLLVEVSGERLRRAYSINSALDDAGPGVAVTIKRVQGGRVSNHLNDHAREGDVLQVLGPSGSFTVAPDPERRRRLVLIGGGSGITPLASIAKSVLAREPRSHVTLLYGNRAEPDVIFRDALDALAEAHPERFVLRHVLEAPREGWTGGRGRLDRATCEAELSALLARDVPEGLEPPDELVEVFVCGPEPMMAAAREAATALGVPKDRLREERFSSPAQRAEAPRPTAPQPITLRLPSGVRAVVETPEQTILEAGLAAGVPMPFSCAMGGCGRCKLKLVDGEVASEEPSCLTEAERAEGFVLACVSRATRPTTLEVA